MARTLTVHRRYLGGLAKLRDLDPAPAQELLAALRDVPSTVSSHSLSAAVAANVDMVAAEDVEAIVPALLHVHSIRDITELPVSDLAEGIAHGMEETPSKEVGSSPDDSDRLQARLVEVLKIDLLRTIARAAGLLSEHERTATDTRIVTDIRPIFEQDSPQTPPWGAVVVHTLKIRYLTESGEKSFFVALDTSDIRELLEQLERANAKAESIRSVLRVPYVDSD